MDAHLHEWQLGIAARGDPPVIRSDAPPPELLHVSLVPWLTSPSRVLAARPQTPWGERMRAKVCCFTPAYSPAGDYRLKELKSRSLMEASGGNKEKESLGDARKVHDAK